MSFLNLCKPALVYLIISTIAIVIMIFQNIGSNNVYCLGMIKCDVPNITLIFIIKILYVAFWTWILNLICRSGNTKIAWILLLLPFILFFILILLLILNLISI